jgi:hypothetical protein
MRSNRKAGLSEVATVAVLILIGLMVVGVVVIWEAQVTRSASEAGRAAAVTEVQRMRQDVSLVYWGPDGTIILTSRARDPVTIVRVYVDSSPRQVSWTISPGETKRFNLGVNYDPTKEVTAFTDKNELIVLWRAGGSWSSLMTPPPSPPPSSSPSPPSQPSSPSNPPSPPSPPSPPPSQPNIIGSSCLYVNVVPLCSGADGSSCLRNFNVGTSIPQPSLGIGCSIIYDNTPPNSVAVRTDWSAEWYLQSGWQYYSWSMSSISPGVSCSGSLYYNYGFIGKLFGTCYAGVPPDKYVTIVVIFVRAS